MEIINFTCGTRGLNVGYDCRNCMLYEECKKYHEDLAAGKRARKLEVRVELHGKLVQLTPTPRELQILEG